MKKAINRALKCFSAINLIGILFFSQLAFAEGEAESASVSYNGKNKTVTVIAEVSTYANAAAVVTVSKDAENTIMNIVRTDSNGVVTHSEVMPEGFEGGRYDVTVSTMEKTLAGYFIYPIAAEIESVLPTINSKTTWQELCQAIKDNSDPLAVDRLIFDPIADNASKILFAQKPQNGWGNAAEFLRHYNNALAAVSLNAGTAPADVFLKYGAAIDFDANKYTLLKNNEKEKVDIYLKDADYTAMLVTEAFYEAKAISQIAVSDSWSALLGNIEDEENSVVLALDKTYFDELVNTDLAYQNLFSQLSGDENIEEIRALFVDVTKECYEKENESVPQSPSKDKDKGGGGGGGVSAPEPKPVEPTIPTEPTTPTEPEEEKPVSTPEFSDMTQHWAKDAVDTLTQSGIIGGFPDGTFRPNDSVTRAQFTVMVARALGISSDEKCALTDIEQGSWYEKSVSAAVQAGIINGMGDDKFCPDEYIKRQDALLIIYRAFNEILKETKNTGFADSLMISDYAREAIDALYAAEIVKGTDDGNLKPVDNTSRAEVATILVRILEKGKE